MFYDRDKLYKNVLSLRIESKFLRFTELIQSYAKN